MADEKPWQSQLPGGGNNIPESYLRKFGLRGETGKRDDEPENRDIARFIRDEL